MKRKYSITSMLAVFSLALMVSSCTKDLDLFPTNDVTSEVVYKDVNGYKQVLGKVYGAFALTGNQGPAGNGDVQGIDEGFSDFYRLFWKAQELSTDEAVITWGDVGIQDFHNMNWTSNNSFLTGLYYRCMYQITLCNEFIRQSSDERLSSRGISGADAETVKQFAREARFLRAFQYWVMMDLFGNPPFATESTEIGGAPPPQATRAEIFDYIVSELMAIEPDMPAPRTNEYGRADQGAVWALLARTYLNADVYKGAPEYSNAVTYAKKVIDAGYTLVSDYRHLMLADNHQNSNEFIFTINYDGLFTQGFGGTTFLTHAPVGGSMSASNFGISGGWAGLRTTKNLVNLFPDANGTTDKRAQFYMPGQNLEIADVTVFTEGYGVTKYRNVTRTGANGSSLDYSDVDIPLFRLAEMYLIYAEGQLRGGGGDQATAVGYINNLRTRAYGNTSGNVSSSQVDLDFILNERARELYWEGFRRTDLVRYNRFTSASYLWPWKGGVSTGTGVAAYRNLYPIPSRDINTNTNLEQNSGY